MAAGQASTQAHTPWLGDHTGPAPEASSRGRRGGTSGAKPIGRRGESSPRSTVDGGAPHCYAHPHHGCPPLSAPCAAARADAAADRLQDALRHGRWLFVGSSRPALALLEPGPHRRRPPGGPVPVEAHRRGAPGRAADQALAQAIQQAETAPRKQAAEAFLAVRKAYPETTAGQEALYRAGVLFFDSQDYVNARKASTSCSSRTRSSTRRRTRKLQAGPRPRWRWAPTATRTRRSPRSRERAEGAERAQLARRPPRGRGGRGPLRPRR